MITETLNGVKTFAPNSRKELMQYAMAHKKIMIAVNAEKILHATDETRELINRNLGYPDGIGAVWALHKKGHKEVVKIPGCELWLDLIQEFYKDKSFYLVGGKQDVIEDTIAKIKRDFPGINICNYRNGYLKTEAEEDELIADIVKLKPDIVFVAMGSPKQELLMERIQKKHPAVYQGLGGSFDVYTGHVKRAPDWWVKNNLEWTYRLINQPSRIKRQIHLVKFFVNLHLNKY
ncbi:WecB/TagA/CpsF family glycosyltransferase [Hanstruepera ponticola]|uniref:WecB/TagA/CpsF family glycosyltransferase n=1 Tax=Hanstruepera ponticola TaxID=2042995 RepID=UPI00178521BE|nr:WecB/TagA/CpsF family glycosyltransferase [Hanstruepera ponticola]